MPRAKPPPRIAFPVVLLAVGMIGIAVYTALSGGGDDPEAAGGRGTSGTTTSAPPLDRARSREVPGAAPLAFAPGPDRYAITYEIREPGRPPTTEVVAVERPWRSRRTTETDSSATSFGRLSTTPAEGARTIVSPPPVAVDPRPSLVVDRAIEEGLLERREQRRVAGRRCQVFRSLSPVSSSTISAALPTRHTDSCISAEGLLLDEWHVADGRAVRQRVAVEVDVTGEDLPAITEPPTVTAAQGGGSVLPVDTASEPPGRFFVLDEPPAGFRLRGRYSLVPPQAGLTDETERRRAVASTADVYERGTDVLVVDRGNTLNLDRAFQPRPEGRPVDLGPLFGEGELLLSWSGPEVRWGDEDGKFVRVYGTLPVEEVVAVARALRSTDGGAGLVFLEDTRLDG